MDCLSLWLHCDVRQTIRLSELIPNFTCRNCLNLAMLRLATNGLSILLPITIHLQGMPRAKRCIAICN